jgi:hypothetical protein
VHSMFPVKLKTSDNRFFFVHIDLADTSEQGIALLDSKDAHPYRRRVGVDRRFFRIRTFDTQHWESETLSRIFASRA